MDKYPETKQQKSVRIGGGMLKGNCSGKKGSDFIQCRSTVLKCAFDDGKCAGNLLDLKKKILKELGY